MAHFWDDANIAQDFLSAKSAHASLLTAVKQLDSKLSAESRLRENLRRRLLIISLLISYLEDRDVFKLEAGFFEKFLPGAVKFFHVLGNAEALIRLLGYLERERFNGNVFTLTDEEKEQLRNTTHLPRFAALVEGKTEPSGQGILWRLYSFRDLPVELISHIYQHFVEDRASCVYTPPFLARLMLDEALPIRRVDRLHQNHEVILDPACGSGVFLVEAFKRLVLHWRGNHDWKEPSAEILRLLLLKVHGVDVDPYAIELASFSLCLAMCEELDPSTILETRKLFPKLRGQTLHPRCFFEMTRSRKLPKKIGVVIGNPPFESGPGKGTATQARLEYLKEYGEASLPDKQVAYLFLHYSIEALTPGGLLCLLQKDNFLYNRHSASFRHRIFRRWNVREILDLTPIRGLFVKDSKVLVVVAEASDATKRQPILHAVFHRTVRTRAEQGFDLDYYDMHWVSQQSALQKDYVWRCNLFGGSRAVEVVERLKMLPTLSRIIKDHGWDYGEGFVAGESGKLKKATHLTGAHYLPAAALTSEGIDENRISRVTKQKFKSRYSPARYTPPLILIRQTDDFYVAFWDKYYLTYDQNTIGIAANGQNVDDLKAMYFELKKSAPLYASWLALTSAQAGFQRESALQKADIDNCPYPGNESRWELSENERIVLSDIRKYYRLYLRHGEKAEINRKVGESDLVLFSKTFERQINTVYKNLHPLKYLNYAGICCLPFRFGQQNADWNTDTELIERLNVLLRQKKSATLTTVRIVRLFEGPFIFLIKPSRLRYWLRSIALRDADETLADLRGMGL